MVACVETGQTFTFICRRDGASLSHVDVRVMDLMDTRAHALRLLCEHQSASVVEIWCEPTLVGLIERSPTTLPIASVG
jgi:hypothetical protein